MILKRNINKFISTFKNSTLPFRIIKSPFLILCFLFLINLHISAQSDAKYYADIVNTNGTKIELWLVKPNETCESSSLDWQFKLKTRKLSSRSSSQRFLTWKMKVVNCDNNYFENVFSIDLNDIADQTDGLKSDFDWTFNAKSIKGLPYENRLQANPNNEKNRFLSAAPVILTPDSITGNQIVKTGQSLILRVAGQTPQGNGDWYWYENICGQGAYVNKGVEFKLQPTETKTYFVRYQDGTNYSDCKYATVILDDKSYSPSSITTDDGTNEICQDATTSKKLTINDGRLGYKAEWVWYKDTIDARSIISKGTTSIDIKPVKTTVYFVRAEGLAGNSDVVSSVIKVVSASEPPLRIGVTPEQAICEGTAIKLFVVGGKLGEGANWVWTATNKNNTYELGGTSSVEDFPKTSTLYSVYAKSSCKSTVAVTKKIDVKLNSVNPSFYQIKIEPIKNSKGTRILHYKLSNTSGKLGDKAQWVWYKDPSSLEKSVVGTEYIYDEKNSGYVYLRAEGECNKTDFIKIPVNGVAIPKTPTVQSTYTKVSKHNSRALKNKLKFGFITAGVNSYNFDTLNVPSVFLALGSQSFYIKSSFTIAGLAGNRSEGIKSPPYLHDGNQIINYPSNTGTYYKFNGYYHPKLSAYTAGVMAGRSWAKIYFGAGYGRYQSLWGVDVYDYNSNQLVKETWSESTDDSFSGPCLESGVFIKMSWLNVSFGLTGIHSFDKSKQFITGQLGVGLSF